MPLLIATLNRNKTKSEHLEWIVCFKFQASSTNFLFVALFSFIYIVQNKVKHEYSNCTFVQTIETRSLNLCLRCAIERVKTDKHQRNPVKELSHLFLYIAVLLLAQKAIV